MNGFISIILYKYLYIFLDIKFKIINNIKFK